MRTKGLCEFGLPSVGIEGERCAERGVHTFPHARWAAGPVNYGGGVRAGDRPGCVGRSS